MEVFGIYCVGVCDPRVAWGNLTMRGMLVCGFCGVSESVVEWFDTEEDVNDRAAISNGLGVSRIDVIFDCLDYRFSVLDYGDDMGDSS